MLKAKITSDMIAFYHEDPHDVNHFLKVSGYASALGVMAALPPEQQQTLEVAAIVHDIACPLCREKYGHAAGHLQEQESEALLRPFLAPYGLEMETVERVIELVCHHHTVKPILGLDHCLLLEADFLVNAEENRLSRDAIAAARELFFRSLGGLRLLDRLEKRLWGEES